MPNANSQCEPSLTSEFPDSPTPLPVGGRLDEPARSNLLATSAATNRPHNQVAREILLENLTNPVDWRTLLSQIDSIREAVAGRVEHLNSENARATTNLALEIKHQLNGVNASILGLAELTKVGAERLERVNTLAGQSLKESDAIGAAVGEIRAAVDAQTRALTEEIGKSQTDVGLVNHQLETVVMDLEYIKRAARVNTGARRFVLPTVSLIAVLMAFAAVWSGMRIVQLEASVADLNQKAATASERAESEARHAKILSYLVEWQTSDVATRQKSTPRAVAPHAN